MQIIFIESIDKVRSSLGPRRLMLDHAQSHICHETYAPCLNTDVTLRPRLANFSVSFDRKKS
jgi:hypothetical protein